jgi:hypothetical protein
MTWMSAVLVVSVLAACGHAGPSPATRKRIKVLTRALVLMRREYGTYRRETPGAEDVLAYQVGDLWKRGIDGTGTTIAVIEGWRAGPLLATLMAIRDKQLGLPDPQIKTIYVTGRRRLPASCPRGMVRLGDYGSCRGWEAEAALDAVSAHMLAPYAKILIVVAPPDSEITDDAASQVAPPEFMQAVEYVSVHHLANVIAISDGTAESTYSPGFEEIRAQDPGELTAAAHGIPLVVGTGDCGAAQRLPVRGGSGPVCTPRSITRGRAVTVWADSPWVTAVGGSIPDLSATGKHLGPDRVWNPSSLPPSGRYPYAEGAGFSAVYGRPRYQNRAGAITGSMWRSLPDITMDAQLGTSEAAPLFAAVLALATELNDGRNVGPLNGALYQVLGPAGVRDGIADVVSGDNTLHIGRQVVVRGFVAADGFDVASGWGTVMAGTFVPALVSATRAARQDAAVRAEATAELTGLEHSEQLSPLGGGRGPTTLLTGQGFLPGHPVKLDIDGRRIVTLHADGHGSVRYRFQPSALGLRAGRHVVALVSMLITTTEVYESPVG